jgi:hypothetical protein
MANRARKRKPVQAGVEAIFTTEKNWKGKSAAAFGVSGLGTGAILWSWLIIQGSSSLTLVSLSMLLVISGVGLCMYSFAIRRTRQETDRLRSALYELDVLTEPKIDATELAPEPYPNGQSRIGNGLPHRSSKTVAIVIAETIGLVVFYGGLVQEYVSNVNMQQWVRSSIWPAAYILNYNALFLVIGGLLGTASFQLLTRKSR